MSLFESPSACRLFAMATPTASTSTQPAPTSKPLVATGDWTKNLVHLAKTAELKYVPNTSIEPEKIIKDLFSQEAWSHSATPYRAYSFCARIVGTKEQGDPGLERTEEQVESPFPSPPSTFFSRGRHCASWKLDPWNADLCCSITHFIIIFRLESERNKLLNALREVRIFCLRFSKCRPS